MNNGSLKKKYVITSCGCDFLMPFALVYLFYIILHGHLSPGGGFQGGVLMVAVFTMMYLGYGREKTVESLSVHGMHTGEGLASFFYECGSWRQGTHRWWCTGAVYVCSHQRDQ